MFHVICFILVYVWLVYGNMLFVSCYMFHVSVCMVSVRKHVIRFMLVDVWLVYVNMLYVSC